VKASVGIVGYAPTYSIISFRVKSVSRPQLVHRVYVQFLGLEDLKDEIGPNGEHGGILEDPVKARDIILSLVKDDIKLHCTCESHQYYRSYQLTQLDASIFPENRPPKINDPSLIRTHMCHHEFATMKYILTYEQHLVKFFMMNDNAIANSLKIDADTAALIQLKDVINTWTGRVGDATNNEKLEKSLKQKIINVLKKGQKFINKFRKESVEEVTQDLLIEEVSEDTILNTTNLFVTYVTDNFIPKEIRGNVAVELTNTILETFSDFYDFESEIEVEEEEPIEEVPIDNIEDENLGDLDMKQNEGVLDVFDIQNKIKRLVEASFEMGPEERVPDSDAKQRHRDMLSKKYDKVPADDLNGPNPIEFKPEEVAVQNAISEYLNQTGKSAYKDKFQDIIIGLLRDFDSPERLEQISRFVGTVTNTTANLRVPQEPEIEEPEVPPMEDEGGFDEGFGDEDAEDIENDAFSDEELNAAKGGTSDFEKKMEDKKQNLKKGV